ncbi:class I SAM-dependent methyltransferase [PVC group bacterium]|nr:class I SAM-dependent methyltransferase [PVC group bacterium]
MTTKQDTITKKISRSIRSPFDKKKSLKRLEKYHSKNRSLEETVDWALNFNGGGGLYRIKTLQKKSEIFALAKLVYELNPKNILEIGTERGGTLFIWAAIASKMAISCDLQQMQIQRELYSKFPPHNSACKVKLLVGDSHTEALVHLVENELQDELVDFLFIDGDHCEEGVAQDFEMYKKFVRKGGLVAFHDIVDNQPLEMNQVQHFWRKIKDQYEHYEFIDNPEQCGYGIGVIRI